MTSLGIESSGTLTLRAALGVRQRLAWARFPWLCYLFLCTLDALSQGERRISLILSKCVFSFSVPSRSVVPGYGCGIADRFLTGIGFSRGAPAGSVRGLSHSPSCCSIVASPQVQWTLGRSCQLWAVSTAAFFPVRKLPDSSGLQIPDILEILFSPKIFLPLF